MQPSARFRDCYGSPSKNSGVGMNRNKREILVELLVLQAQAGDPRAIGSLASIFQAELLAYSFRLLADSHEACDAVQDSWLSVIQGIGKLKDPASFRVWIFRIVHNKSMNHLRKKVRDRNEAKELLQSRPLTIEHRELGPNDELENLHKLINELPPTDRGTLTLFYENCLSIREIAIVTNTSDSAVKSRLFHIRQRIKEKLIIFERDNDGKL